MHDLFSGLPDWDLPSKPEPRKAYSDAVSPGHVRSSVPTTTAPETAVRRTPCPQPRKAAAREYPAYFDTTGVTNLDEVTVRALALGALIERFFRGMPAGTALAPSQVLRRLGTGHPITSVRRAMTVLTERGILDKTDVKIIGPHNEPEHTWRLAVAETKRAA